MTKTLDNLVRWLREDSTGDDDVRHHAANEIERLMACAEEALESYETKLDRLQGELRGADDEIKYQENLRRHAESRLGVVEQELREAKSHAIDFMLERDRLSSRLDSVRNIALPTSASSFRKDHSQALLDILDALRDVEERGECVCDGDQDEHDPGCPWRDRDVEIQFPPPGTITKHAEGCFETRWTSEGACAGCGAKPEPDIAASNERQDAYWRRVGGHPPPEHQDYDDDSEPDSEDHGRD